MTLNSDVKMDEIVNSKADMSGADIKAICLEAGLLALRARRMRVCMEDFRQARDKVLFKKQEQLPDLYTWWFDFIRFIWIYINSIYVNVIDQITLLLFYSTSFYLDQLMLEIEWYIS